MKPKLPPLDELLKYQNDDVITYYMREYNLPKDFAEEMFQEILKYFWLYQKNKLNDDGIYMGFYKRMKVIDWMWHCFIQFTVDYREFCHKYFGTFIDHHIYLEEKDATDEQLKSFLVYVNDNLGEDTLEIWFRESNEKVLDEHRYKLSLKV